MDGTTVYTIGHSSHSLDEFLSLLSASGITAVADVRSSPFSKRSPHFNRRALEASLREQNIDYRFFGKALGGRPSDPRLYVDGTADYEAMAECTSFKEAIDRVLKGAKKHRLALMCSERDPIECHRCLLVGRALSKRGLNIIHVLPDETSQSQQAVEARLLKLNRQLNHDFFVPHDEQLEIAYRDQSVRVAFTERPTRNETSWEFNDVEYH